MTPELPPKPAPTGPVPAAPRRTTPCAGLFGWRVPKDRTGNDAPSAKATPVHQRAR